MKYIIETAKKNIAIMSKCKKKDDQVQYLIIKSALTTLIRKWCDKMPIVFVSENAKREADKLKINLFKLQWKDQKKFDKKRKVFHLEHKYTVNDMIRDMLKDPELIEQTFQNYQIGWILKSEDKKLKKTNRINHNITYSNANIDLIFISTKKP